MLGFLKSHPNFFSMLLPKYFWEMCSITYCLDINAMMLLLKDVFLDEEGLTQGKTWNDKYRKSNYEILLSTIIWLLWVFVILSLKLKMDDIVLHLNMVNSKWWHSITLPIFINSVFVLRNNASNSFLLCTNIIVFNVFSRWEDQHHYHFWDEKTKVLMWLFVKNSIYLITFPIPP